MKSNEWLLGQELGELKIELQKYKDALERRDEFIQWLTEVKHDSSDTLSELWDEFEKYEDILYPETNNNEPKPTII